MALRRIEILCPLALRAHFEQLARSSTPIALWVQCDDKNCELRALVDRENVEALLSDIESFLALQEDGTDVQVAVLEVKASLPRARPEPAKDRETIVGRARERRFKRISRDELSAEIAKGADLDAVFLVTVVLSTIVATIGLLRNSPATVIGAMVIAPLMGPNIALALATTLGDAQLAKRALVTSAAGLATAVGAAGTIALFLPQIAPEAVPEIAARVQPHWSDAVLALASGVAGALAYTTGVSTSLVGVMVAVALLPPTVVATMLAIQGQGAAVQAALLVATNVFGVMLAAIATFRVQGIHPHSWWDKQRTVRRTTWALILLFALLCAFTALLVLRAR